MGLVAGPIVCVLGPMIKATIHTQGTDLLLFLLGRVGGGAVDGLGVLDLEVHVDQRALDVEALLALEDDEAEVGETRRNGLLDDRRAVDCECCGV